MNKYTKGDKKYIFYGVDFSNILDFEVIDESISDKLLYFLELIGFSQADRVLLINILKEKFDVEKVINISSLSKNINLLLDKNSKDIINKILYINIIQELLVDKNYDLKLLIVENIIENLKKELIKIVLNYEENLVKKGVGNIISGKFFFRSNGVTYISFFKRNF